MINPGLIYLIGSIGLYLIKKEWRQKFALIIAVLSGVTIFSLTQGQAFKVPFLDFELILVEVTAINQFIGFIFVFFSIASIIYGANLLTHKDYWLSYFYIGSSLAIVFVGDFFSFYICWELMTISSYFLIFKRDNALIRQSSYYYFMMHLVGAISLLWGILLHYNSVGSMALTTVKIGLPFFVLAVGIKLAFIGLHTWLPKTYAQTPFYISVILSAYTTKVGVYACYKLLRNINYLAYAGVFSAVIAALWALRQNKIRKILSYLLISQIGYMIIAIGSTSELSKIGTFLHLGNHIVYKGLLFMAIGVIIYTTGEEDLRELNNLAKKLPKVAFLALIGLASISGIPLFNGHISKLLIKKGLASPILTWGLYLAGVINAMVVIKIAYFTFFNETKNNIKINKKPTKSMITAMTMLAILNLVVGLKPQLMLGVLGGISKEINYFSLHYIWVALQPTLIAVILFKLAYEIIKPQHYQEYNFDLYLFFGRGVDAIGNKLSQWHNGDLRRYILWFLTALILLWGQALI
ncbi:MAG: proton-conducting transporter membrane subunit [Bacillota bacterium]